MDVKSAVSSPFQGGQDAVLIADRTLYAPVSKRRIRKLTALSKRSDALTYHYTSTDTDEQDMVQSATSINLVASENHPTRAVCEAVAAPIPDTEGYPGKRYHGGKQLIDEMERLCWRRALETFELDEREWAVNVQALSGSLANIFSYIALLEPEDVIMGLELSHGGHISHGHQTSTRKVSETAIRFTSIPYHVDIDTGLIDYDGLESLAVCHKPRIIVVGGSAYSRLIDFARVRQIADHTGALIHCDMAHFCGLVAAQVIPSPFPYCDIVTTTTNKTFRGPDAAIIFCKKWMEDQINQTVFPRFQAGTHHTNIIALAVALLQARTPESRSEQKRIVASAQVLAERLTKLGYRLPGGGTETHLLLVDLRPNSIDARKVERVLELARLYCNRNAVPGDKPGVFSGIRLGTASMVVRGMASESFGVVANLIHEGIGIASVLASAAAAHAKREGAASPWAFPLFLDFVGDGSACASLLELRRKVCSLAQNYPPPWQPIEADLEN